MSITKRSLLRFASGVSALVLGSIALTVTGSPASAAVSCGGYTATQAAAAGYNVIDFSSYSTAQGTSGTSNDDWILGSSGGPDSLQGGSGNDIICSNGGDDYLYGDSGDDLLVLGDTAAYAEGGPDNDTIHGGGGN